MINSTGTVQLMPSTLIAYISPKISIEGHTSSAETKNVMALSLKILSQDLGESASAGATVSTKSVEDLVKLDNVKGEDYAADSYPVLEKLLLIYLQEVNPSATFEIV